ncbi:hypothetical protein MXB_1128, partial [Myxobolus squamalis]
YILADPTVWTGIRNCVLTSEIEKEKVSSYVNLKSSDPQIIDVYAYNENNKKFITINMRPKKIHSDIYFLIDRSLRPLDELDNIKRSILSLLTSETGTSRRIGIGFVMDHPVMPFGRLANTPLS